MRKQVKKHRSESDHQGKADHDDKIYELWATETKPDKAVSIIKSDKHADSDALLDYKEP